MIIYKDIITGDELFSDNYPIKLIDDLYYEVEGKIVQQTAGDIDESLIGGNKSAEAPPDEVYSPDAVFGCNIVFHHRLEATTPFSSKAEFIAPFKQYVKRIYEKLVADKSERAEAFKSGMSAVLKKLLAMRKDLIPYVGESLRDDGMVAFMNYRESGDPYMIFIKDGLNEEKV